LHLGAQRSAFSEGGGSAFNLQRAVVKLSVLRG
jgi:hypothetical protein